MIFLQALISEKSPAFKLFEFVERATFTLFINNEILDEINNVLSRPYIRDKNPQITDESVKIFLSRVLKKAVLLIGLSLFEKI